ncbi:MAG: ribosome maturation factor RimP [Lachnospiraceae bacterium]|jgi:ribosome maturation factor RimP
MEKADIESRTEKLIGPILEQNEFELVDVEYVKEGNDRYLRAYIDKEGGININDCELVSRALEEKLDVADFIREAYILEVSSPGLTRPLKKEKDFARNKGRQVEIHLYRPVDKSKIFIGTLVSFDNYMVTIEDENGKPHTFKRKEMALIRQYFEF